MQAIMETIFDIAYLVTVIVIGIIMMRKAKDTQFRLFGRLAFILGVGDAFHLVPRILALLTGAFPALVVSLGFGKLITSITMTIFYIMLYVFWRVRYKIQGRTQLTWIIFALGLVRIALCLFPQNQWLSADSPLIWGIIRNIPFTILGIIILYLFFVEAKKQNDQAFKWAWLAITLSFALYIPVVLWADKIPLIGMLMIPKTLAYVWLILMGFGEFRKIEKK